MPDTNNNLRKSMIGIKSLEYLSSLSPSKRELYEFGLFTAFEITKGIIGKVIIIKSEKQLSDKLSISPKAYVDQLSMLVKELTNSDK